ncbi:MAG: hypothetical protein PHY29_02360 [Syntrophales bacterium]|nr:hypothetical protein [Syntrophales bacterium]
MERDTLELANGSLFIEKIDHAFVAKNVTLLSGADSFRAEDGRSLQILLASVQGLLDKNGIEGRVQGRNKGLFAIRSKMIRTGKSLEEIMDRVGLRVIVASVPECYAALDLLHDHFESIPGTLDDYIALPKANGYQSLHTCVYPSRKISHKPIEFQIRTELMHIEAEYGAAAHWRYKIDTVSAMSEKIRMSDDGVFKMVSPTLTRVNYPKTRDLVDIHHARLPQFGVDGEVEHLRKGLADVLLIQCRENTGNDRPPIEKYILESMYVRSEESHCAGSRSPPDWNGA